MTFTVDEIVHFDIIEALINKGYKKNEMIDISILKEDLKPVIGQTAYEALETLYRLGYIEKDHMTKYGLTGASFSLYDSI